MYTSARVHFPAAAIAGLGEVMSRVILSVIAATIVTGALAACAPAPREVAFATPARPRGLTCDTATSNVATFGRSNAKLYSEIALKDKVSELRGYMLNSGIRRIRLVQKTNECGSGGAFADFYQCTARAQLCGH